MWIRLHVKHPLFLSDFNETWVFSTDLWKKPKYKLSSKSIECEWSCSMRTDRRTDMKLIVAFRKCTKASKSLFPETCSEEPIRKLSILMGLYCMINCGFLTINHHLEVEALARRWPRWDIPYVSWNTTVQSVFTRARHFLSFWPRLIQFTPFYSIFLIRLNVIVPSTPRFCKWHFFIQFSGAKTLHAFLFVLTPDTSSSHLILFYLIA